jgi:hypothetical protein
VPCVRVRAPQTATCEALVSRERLSRLHAVQRAARKDIFRLEGVPVLAFCCGHTSCATFACHIRAGMQARSSARKRGGPGWWS